MSGNDPDFPNPRTYQNPKFKKKLQSAVTDNESTSDTDDDTETTSDSGKSDDEPKPVTNFHKRKKYGKVASAQDIRNFGSVFDQLRMLPSSPFYQGEPSVSMFCDKRKSTAILHPLPWNVRSEIQTHTMNQNRKTFKLLSSWMEEGRYPRIHSMKIAANLFNIQLAEEHIQAELNPKQKFAYKKFCLEIDDKFQMITKGEFRGREPFSERTFRKMWHLYALYRKARSERHFDERTNEDIVRRAIAHVVKKTMVGPDAPAHNQQSNFEKLSNPIEEINPVLAKCLQDPIHAFLIVYGRFVSAGKVNKFERLQRLIHFNQIAKQFYDRLAEPPCDIDVDTYLLQLRQEQQQRQRFQQSKHDLFPNFSSSSLHHQRSISLPLAYSTANQRNKKERYNSAVSNASSEYISLMNLEDLQELDILKRYERIDDEESEEEEYDMSLSDITSFQTKIGRFDGKKRICLVGSRYEVLPAVASDLGFEIVNENDLWNINWSDSPMPQDKICQMRRIQDMYSVFWGNNAPLQKTNHFPGMYEICRKDRLGRNLNRLRRMFPNEFNFFPETWDLPTEQTDLIAFARRRRNATYIVKPEAGCQGKGIFLLRNPKKLSPFTKCVCQVYIPHPFLIDGYKFDQRIYVLITCVDPLRVYIYEEGIARFATVKYETPTDENLEVVFMHLTNYSLNKFSESYVREGDGSKRKVSAVYKWMAEKGCDIPKLTEAIDEIIVKTLLCAAPTLKHNYRTCFPKKDRGCSCFELLGFDILIDRNLKPILLEVNHSPSFNLDLPVDGEVKTALLKDMFNMVYLGDELNAAASKQKRKCFRKSRKNSDDSSGSASRKKKRPTSPVVEESFENLSKPLRKQFQHELKRKGNFRLIYSSDKPGRFANMMDDNYCGYQTLTGPVNQSAEPSQAISESKPIKKKYYHPFSFDSEHEVGKRRQGQPYLEPSLTNALLSRSNLPAAASRNVIQSRFREAHHGSSLSLTMNQRGIITRTFCKKPDPPGQDKRGAKVESKKSINIMNTSMINKNKSKSFGHGEMGETEEKCQIFYDNKNYNRR